MSEKEQTFIRQVAIGTWRLICPEAKATGEARDAEERRRIESFRRELQKIAGYNIDFNIRVNGACLEAIVDDLRFVAYEITSSNTEDHGILVTLLGRCSACGVETLSQPVSSLAGLGKILERFVPIYSHYCSRQAQTTVQNCLKQDSITS